MTTSADTARYGAPAVLMHWLTALLVAVQVPVGIVMSHRGNVLNLWDDITGVLYSTHKSIGFVLLALVVVRALVRLIAGAPAAEPSLPPWQRAVAAVNHAGLYGLLLVVPLLGWLGASLFPALEVFGIVSLPAITGADRAMSDRVFAAHRLAAFMLIALIAVHVGATLYHRWGVAADATWDHFTTLTFPLWLNSLFPCQHKVGMLRRETSLGAKTCKKRNSLVPAVSFC